MPTTAIALATAVVVVTAFDLAVRRVPNWLNAGILGVGLTWRLAATGPSSALMGLGGAACGLLLLFPFFEKCWVGGGDVKLAAALGAWLGPWPTVVAVLLGAIGGGVLALGWWLSHAELRRSVGPALAVSARILQAPAAPARPRRMTVPLAVSLGVAAVLVHAQVVVV